MEKRGKVNLPYLSKAENMEPISSNIPPLIAVSLKPKPNYANQVTRKLRENNLIGDSFFFFLRTVVRGFHFQMSSNPHKFMEARTNTRKHEHGWTYTLTIRQRDRQKDNQEFSFPKTNMIHTVTNKTHAVTNMTHIQKKRQLFLEELSQPFYYFL